MKVMDHAPERKTSFPLVDFKRYGTSAWPSPQAQAGFSTFNVVNSFIVKPARRRIEYSQVQI